MRVRPSLFVAAAFLIVAGVWPAAQAAGPSLTWTQMGSSYRSPDPEANWSFQPCEFNGSLFVPMGDYGACVVKRWTGSDWADDFLDDHWGTGRDFENLTFLQVFNNRMYMTCETDSQSAYNHGVMVRNTAGTWSVSYPYTYTSDPLMQMGSFGTAIHNGKLYTGVNPYPAGTLTIYEHDGATWTPIKYYHTGEQLRAWSLGSDGTNLYVGIGTRARNNAASLGIERYNGTTWATELASKAVHSMAHYKGSMYAGGGGVIYKRSTSGTWSQVFSTGQAHVTSMTIIDYDGTEVLYAGADARPTLYSTLDGANWDMVHQFDTGSGNCSVGQYQNTPVVAVTYYEGSTPKVVRVWHGAPQNVAPVIAEVTPDPDSAIGGSPYTRQLSLIQGSPAPSWSVISGPTGLTVSETGYVSGWTPSTGDIGQSFPITIRAVNALGSDDESWTVNVVASGGDWVFEDCLTDVSKTAGTYGSGTFSAGGYTLSHSGGVCCETGTPRSVDFVWYDLPKSGYGGSWSQGTIEFDVTGLLPGVGLDKTELFAACDSTGLNPATTDGQFYDSPYYTIFRKANDNYGNQDVIKSTVKGGNGIIEQWSNVLSWSGTTVYRFRYTWNGTDAHWYRGLPGQTLTEISPPSPFSIGTWSPNTLHIQVGSTFRAGPRNICSSGGYPGTVYKLLRVYNVDKGSAPTPAGCPGGDPTPAAPIIAEVTPDPDLAATGTQYTRQLCLVQGSPAPAWTVITGPAGLDVSGGGYVHGWTPTGEQAGQLVDITIRAANSEGADDESWQVLVTSPPTGTVAAFPFTSGVEGWVLETWGASTSYDPGAIAWQSSGGNPGGSLEAGGRGATNNSDSCTREGAAMTRLVSTAGYDNIEVSYDVVATLNTPPESGCGGNCVANLLEGTCEDKLVVYYSTGGTDGPWHKVQELREGIDLPSSWTREVVSLAGVPAVADNPGFALRLNWQFNTVSDYGRIDNVTIAGDALATGDFDRDGDVDQSDFGHLQACCSGTGQPRPDGCDDADLDNDNDVDQADVDQFIQCMGGAGLPPACG